MSQHAILQAKFTQALSETTWVYSVQDYSPLVTYAGSGSAGQAANLDPAWEQSCAVIQSAQLGTIAICDVSSSHTTTVAGASVSLSFFGRWNFSAGGSFNCTYLSSRLPPGNAIQLIGNVSLGMGYTIQIDNSTFPGTPDGQTLASISGLVTGYHKVSIIANPPANVNSAATLLFESAVVTVGTGLTG
jgi:hypothetical protein